MATERPTTTDCAALYRANREAFAALVRSLAAARLDDAVPATPDWSVRDVVAHVVGITTDLNAQRFPAADDPEGVAWTAAQVERGRGRAIDEVLAEWEREAPMFERGLTLFGYGLGSHYVADLHAHAQDVRGALGLPADRDELTVRVALDHYLTFYDELLHGDTGFRLDVDAGGEHYVLGAGGRGASVRGDSFELLRMFSGRRSERQARALEWSGDVDRLFVLLRDHSGGAYSMPETDLED